MNDSWTLTRWGGPDEPVRDLRPGEDVTNFVQTFFHGHELQTATAREYTQLWTGYHADLLIGKIKSEMESMQPWFVLPLSMKAG